MACTFGLFEQFLYLHVIGVVEVEDDICVFTNCKAESSFCYGFPQFFRHSLGHVFVIGGFCIDAAYVMIADHSNERQVAKFLLEAVHDIAEHLLVYFAFSTVALDEIAHLEYHASVWSNQF